MPLAQFVDMQLRALFELIRRRSLDKPADADLHEVGLLLASIRPVAFRLRAHFTIIVCYSRDRLANRSWRRSIARGFASCDLGFCVIACTTHLVSVRFGVAYERDWLDAHLPVVSCVRSEAPAG
jgi:hypothetical protein